MCVFQRKTNHIWDLETARDRAKLILLITNRNWVGLPRFFSDEMKVIELGTWMILNVSTATGTLIGCSASSLATAGLSSYLMGLCLTDSANRIFFWFRTTVGQRREIASMQRFCSMLADAVRMQCNHSWQQSQQMLARVSVRFCRHTPWHAARKYHCPIQPPFFLTVSFRIKAPVSQCPAEITTFVHVIRSIVRTLLIFLGKRISSHTIDLSFCLSLLIWNDF